MAKVLCTISIEKEQPRNRVAVAMQAQKLGRRIMKDRRQKRVNRSSWKKDVDG